MKKVGVLLLSLLLLIGMMPHIAYATGAPDFDQELTQYLDEISTTRGLQITKEMLEASMSAVGQNFSDLKTIDEVKSYFGEVIQSDYGNLKDILDTYQLTMPELQQLLAGYGEELTDYIFLDELDFAVYYYSTDSASDTNADPTVTESPDVTQPVFDEAMLSELLTTMDLSEQELQTLSDYMSSMEGYFSDPLFLSKMNVMQKRLAALSDINEETMTAEQAGLFADWFHDFFDLFRLQPAFYMLKDGEEIPLTIDEALQDKDFLSQDFKIVLYSSDSKLLADFVIDHHKLEALFGNLDTAAEEFGSAIDTAKQSVVTGKSVVVPKTIKGGKLPKTAANYLPGIVLGLAFLLTGLILYKKAEYEKKKILSQR